MTPRKTCPTCHHPYKDGKDPADPLDGLMSMRLSDLCKGVAGSDYFYDNAEAQIFGAPVEGELEAGIVAWRVLSLQDAAELLSAALDRIEAAQVRFAACPAIASLPAFVQRHGQPGDGLTGKRLDVAGVRVEWDGEHLTFKDSAERQEEDGQWLSI